MDFLFKALVRFGALRVCRAKRKAAQSCTGVVAGAVAAVLLLNASSAEAQTAKLATLYSFSGGADGAVPKAGLVLGNDGNFYGATSKKGGSSGGGTVFKLTPTGVLTTLHTFTGGTDQGQPYATLIQASDGSFYGATRGYCNSGAATCNGPVSYSGTVFKVTSAGEFTTLHTFVGDANGGVLMAALLEGSDGNFYGPTHGLSDYGTLFKLTPAGDLTTLYSFVGTENGVNPVTALIQTSDGNLYGTTDAFGSGGYGTVFRMTPAGMLTTLYSFGGGTDGAHASSLVRGRDGNFYGTTAGNLGTGGTGSHGTVFKITPAGALTTLYAFNGTTDGGAPKAALVEGDDGNFYGTTSGFGTNSSGTIFKITPAGALTTLYSFSGTDGATPEAALIFGADGNLYGTATAGGKSSAGIVFKAVIVPTATPTFSPVAGTYATAQSVSISDSTSGTTIYYTVDGSTPTESSTKYSGPISVASSMTIKAIATAANHANSAVASATYAIQPAAAKPTFSPAGGTYNSSQSVTITDSTTGATIYYTVDGSTPTAASTKYSSPIVVSKSETIKAVAVASGYANSAVATATYTIQTPAATPTFSLATGTYTGTQTVTISDATSGATIRYTTDGSTPTASSTLYSGPVSISKTATLKAIAMASGYADSAVASATYTIQTRAATPTFNPAGGTYNSSQSVTISDSTSGATIRYTTDGSTPTAASTPYSGPISVTRTTTLKAIAVASGYADSAVASASYTIQTPAATPTFNPGGGTYTGSQSVTISDGTAGASIYYTTDGSTPTTSSSKYTGPIAVSSSKTLKAIATATGYSTSAVASATYTIQSQAATPAFSPAGGTYTGTQSITITDGTAGAIIRYTTDGSTPTASSTQYTGPISVSSSMTIKAIAIASGYANSAVAGASYTILTPAATPTFSPAGGTYTGSQTVTLSDATSGATIRYTTDGSTPTASSTPYSGPITISSTTTVKAIAMASGYANSAVANSTYTILMPAATPTFSLASGTYKGVQSVTISDSTSGATIRYTTDGTTPTVSSTQYTGPISVSSSMTIKAIATASGYANSAVASATYNIEAASGSDDSSGGGGATSPALLGLFAVSALLRRSGLDSRRRSKRHQRAA